MSMSAGLAGRKAEHSDWLDHAVRIGLVAYGVVHLLIGWLAVQLALGDQSEHASQPRARSPSSPSKPFGKVLVWAVAIGMFLLVVWRVLEAAFGHQREARRATRLQGPWRLGVQGRDLRGPRGSRH